MYLEIGDKERAKDYLLKGLAIVEYPALRELLEEIDVEVPQQRGAAKITSVSDRLSFDGEVPQWAERAAEVMVDIEKWRGLKFKEKVTITFQNTGDNIAGWYDHVTKELVVGDQGNKRFSEGVMLHELYHALQDQNFDLTKLESKLKSPDSIKALRAVIEGEAMLAVSEMMDYDFLSHVRYSPKMTDGQFRKFFDYGEGMKFVKAVKEAGGWDAVTEIYKDPPLSTKAILRSELYLSKENQPQHLPHSVKLKRNEKLLRVESKGAYGWMWFLIQKDIENRAELIALYEEDQYITVASKSTTYTRWRVGFGSSKLAKKAANLLQSDNIDFSRKGRWLEIDIEK